MILRVYSIYYKHGELMIQARTRIEALKEIRAYVKNSTKSAGLCYLRGRRRVGKSTILEHLAVSESKTYFYFMGRLDEKSAKTLSRCAKGWDQFTQKSSLSRIKTSELNWDLFFQELIFYGKKQKNNFCLCFDEIQWIAKEQSGFLGALKEYWLQIEKIKCIRIIVCGSSFRFFEEMTGGEEKLIRGLKTHADIWLKPFSLGEVRRFYANNFNEVETLLAYSFLGGVPYYWNQIDPHLKFIQSINKTCFSKMSIFLEEYLEILNLEFQKNSIQTLTRMLSHVNGHGKTAAGIAKDSGLADSTVNDLLEKLEKYQLIFRKTPIFAQAKKNLRGDLYYIKDFYLNFYFRILSQYKGRIQRNTKEELLFARLFEASPKGFYIPNYTGPMYELIIQTVLETSQHREEKIFKKLHLDNNDFEVGFHWDKNSQFDLILHNTTDRVLRFIECKWTEDHEQLVKCLREFSQRVELLELKSSYEMVLCLNHLPAKSIIQLAQKEKITLIYPDDLF